MTWLFILLGYIIGSIPTAYIVGRILKGKDVRQMGDGNMGARNAYHELGHKAGVFIFFADVTKGALPVLIAQSAYLSEEFILITGAVTVVGHNWPMFLGFRGGRGEAATIGVLLALITVPMLILAGPVIATLLIKRNVMLTSCVLFIPLPLVCWAVGAPGMLVGYSVALPCLVGITHYLRTRREVKPSGAGSA